MRTAKEKDNGGAQGKPITSKDGMEERNAGGGPVVWEAVAY